KLHEKIANQRKDFLHKESHKLAKRYDCVVIEDLNMKGMSQALHFGQRVHDNGWGMFTSFLRYKLEEQGKKLIKIDKWFPSSKTCSCCGRVKESLSLSERTFRCECGFESDRDVNAAINIKHEGMKRFAIV
ncbi:RNA-guided endonuclease InsQ/TnpB family protein, partial [Geobacillus stearothermophilus]